MEIKELGLERKTKVESEKEGMSQSRDKGGEGRCKDWMEETVKREREEGADTNLPLEENRG